MNNRSGFILLNKESGMTSHTAIAKCKKKLGLKKIGHCGTLDPMATGLLICLTGRATKLAQYIEKQDKIYTGEILFGLNTSTDDIEGEVLKTKEVGKLEQDQIAEIIKKDFEGEISQTPPKVSALKVNGRRAYQMAREGKDFELAKRKVRVKFLSFELITENKLSFEISCSSGTYIRSIARDLGEFLGVGGSLAKLTRTNTGKMSLSDAVDYETLSAEHIYCWEKLFPDALRIQVTEESLKKIKNGLCSELDRVMAKVKQDSKIVIYEFANQAQGMFVRNENKWKLAI